MELSDLQAVLDENQGPYGHRLHLTVTWDGRWTAEVVNIAQGAFVGPSWKAAGVGVIDAATKAVKSALRHAPLEAWPYVPGYIYVDDPDKSHNDYADAARAAADRL